MSHPVRRRIVLQAGLATAVALVAPAARACEFFTTTLRVFRPWTRATAPGDAFAVLCMGFDQVTSADRLIRVETPVAASAEMAGIGAGPSVDLVIPAGQETVLSESTTFIRLLGLKHPLEMGRSYPLRLVFEKGGAVEADLDVDFERDA